MPPTVTKSNALRRELRALVTLAAPLLATNFGTLLLGAVDTAIVGRLGETPLAAVGLGSSLFFTISVVGWGLMLALDPLIAQALGAREPERARHFFSQGLWVALLGAVPLSLIVLGAGALLERMGIEAETAAQTRAYLHGRLPAMFPWLAFAASRALLQASEVTRPLVIGVVAANVLNVPLTWLLVFGDDGLVRLGLPALGVTALGTAGAGVASAASTMTQLAIALLAIRGLSKQAMIRRPDRAVMWRVVRLGTPIGLTLLAETASFAMVSVLMGNFGERVLASHNVAMTLASMTFQVALALGAAGSVRVGHAVGRADLASTRRAGFVAIACGSAAMMLGAFAFLVFPRELARLLTDQHAVIEAAVPLLAVAAAFQLSDGVQAVASGVLRGAGDTRIPLVANLAGHYAIGIPLGASLAFVAGWNGVGLWWGLSAGLTAVAVLLTVRFWRLSGRTIARA